MVNRDPQSKTSPEFGRRTNLLFFTYSYYEHIELQAKLLDYFLRSNKKQPQSVYSVVCQKTSHFTSDVVKVVVEDLETQVLSGARVMRDGVPLGSLSRKPRDRNNSPISV